MLNDHASYQRIALVIQYQGTYFHGWQRQPHNQRTVQQVLEETITKIVEHPVTIYGAGRTDAGVHAAAQVAHFHTTSPIPAHRWPAVLNSRLPADILIRGAIAVDQQWHARFSASYRRYRYLIYTDQQPNLFLAPFTWHYYHAPVDEKLIQEALTPLQGRHHLAAFHRTQSSRDHSWVDVHQTVCYRQGPLVYIEVQANGFLYGMMRLLVGMLIQVGIGERSLENFADTWENERREVVKYAAPAQGLCLLRVGYPDFPLDPEIWYDTMPKFLFSSN